MESAKFTGKISGVCVLFLCIYLLYKTNIQTGVAKLGLEAQGGAQQAGVGVRIRVASTLQRVVVEDLKSYCLKVETSRSWLLAGNSL